MIDVRYTQMAKWFLHNCPGLIDRWIESVSPNQVECKQWLVESLDNVQIPRDKNGKFKVEIIGGWFGYPLIEMLYEKFGDEIDRLVMYDSDPFACRVAMAYSTIFNHQVEVYNKDYFKDVGELHDRRAHLVINTSCEHMFDMVDAKDFYISPERTLLVLQSNNKRNEEDHINCVDSCDELAKKAGIRTIFGDWKRMNYGPKHKTKEERWAWKAKNVGSTDKYIRYMVMGKWND